MFSYKEEDLFLFPFYDHQQNQKQLDFESVRKKQQDIKQYKRMGSTFNKQKKRKNLFASQHVTSKYS